MLVLFYIYSKNTCPIMIINKGICTSKSSVGVTSFFPGRAKDF